MLRVFLVIDDYNELIYIQSLLKKLGLDVEGIQNTKKYNDVSLGFNPHILLTTAYGKQVNGVELARSIRKNRGLPKIIVLQSSEKTVSPEAMSKSNIDDVLTSPVNPKQLIMKIAEYGNLDETSLLDKYSKIKGQIQTDEANKWVTYDDNGQPIDDVQMVKSSIQSLKEKSIENLLKTPHHHLGGSAPPATENHGDSPAEVHSDLQVDHERNSAERKGRFDQVVAKTGPLPERHFDRQSVIDFNKQIRASEPVEDIDDIENERKKFVRSLFRAGKK